MITRSMTVDDFLVGALRGVSTPLNQNVPYARFAWKSISIGGERFGGDLCFQTGRLFSVTLAVSRPEFGSSWSDWSEGAELAREAAHDQLLQGALGRRASLYSFAWGTVESLYDQRAGGSSILIHYSP